MKTEIKLLDGSLSYPLEKQGYNLNKKLWTGDALINNPNVIKKIHKDYLSAGVDYISTSTYQISYKILNEMGYNLNEIKDISKNIGQVKIDLDEKFLFKIKQQIKYSTYSSLKKILQFRKFKFKYSDLVQVDITTYIPEPSNYNLLVDFV